MDTTPIESETQSRRYYGTPQETGDKLFVVTCGECGRMWQKFGNDECCTNRTCKRGREQRAAIRKESQ